MNTKLILSWYGSVLALGFEATTPVVSPNSSPAERKAAADLAREQIEQDSFNLYNFGAFEGELHWTHDRFAYVVTDEKRLTKALEDIAIFRESQHKRSLTPAERRNFHSSVSTHRQDALRQFESITRENFLVGQSQRRAAFAHNVETGGASVLREDALLK